MTVRRKLAWISIGIAAIVALGAFLLLRNTETLIVGPLALEEGEASLWVEVKPSHPYLAEYNRTLVVTRGATEVRQPLFPDTGGYVRLNIYLHNPQAAMVKVPFEELLVHLDPLRFEKLTKPMPVTGKYLAALARDPSGKWRFIPAAEANEVPVGAPK